MVTEQSWLGVVNSTLWAKDEPRINATLQCVVLRVANGSLGLYTSNCLATLANFTLVCGLHTSAGKHNHAPNTIRTTCY
jgi:hypothetical protein